MKLYTVWTGQKFKGSWPDKDVAIGYMAARDKPERDAWTLVEVDLAVNLSAEVEEKAKASDAAKLQAAIKAHPSIVHHLKAVSVEAVAKPKQG